MDYLLVRATNLIRVLCGDDFGGGMHTVPRCWHVAYAYQRTATKIPRRMPA